MKTFKKYMEAQHPSQDLLNRTRVRMDEAQQQMKLEKESESKLPPVSSTKKRSAFHWKRYVGLAAALAVVVGLGCIVAKGLNPFYTLSEDTMRPITQTQFMVQSDVETCNKDLGVDVGTLLGGYTVNAVFCGNTTDDSNYYLLSYQGETYNLRLLLSNNLSSIPKELLEQEPGKLKGTEVWFGTIGENQQVCSAWSHGGLYYFLMAHDVGQRKFQSIVGKILADLE